MQDFQDSFALPIPTRQRRDTSTSRIPSRAPSVAADVVVPFLSAVALGVLTLITWVTITAKSGEINLPDAAIAGAITAVLTFLSLIILERPLRWTLEEKTRVDLDHDGIIGQPPPVAPPPPPQVIRDPILVRAHDGNSLVMSTLLDGTEIEQEKLVAFVHQGMKERGLTLDAARRCDLTREEWDSIIEHGAELGLWMDKSQGVDALPLVAREQAVRRMLATTGG